MYSIADGITPVDLGIACIVLIGYISGKLWMYYRIDSRDTKPKRDKKGVIKRGPEWDKY
jgi:hypothetical protein